MMMSEHINPFRMEEEEEDDKKRKAGERTIGFDG